LEKGRELPEWFLEETPELAPGEEFYMRAFWRLSTMRNFGGPIPHDKIQEYGEKAGLEEDNLETFLGVIELLDRGPEGYLAWQESQRPKG